MGNLLAWMNMELFSYFGDTYMTISYIIYAYTSRKIIYNIAWLSLNITGAKRKERSPTHGEI